MSLLSNMTIERTSSSMSASSSAGGYRYIGGDGVDVNNDIYQITAKIDDATIKVDAEGQMYVSGTLYTAGDNVHITVDSETGTRTISADMFQSQFSPGDRVRYEAGLNDIITLKANVAVLRDDMNRAQTDIAANNVDIDTLDEAHDANEGRLDSVESRVSYVERRLDTAEGEIDSLQTNDEAQDAKLYQHDNKIYALEQTVASHSEFIEEFTNLDSTLGGIGSQISGLQTDVDDLGSYDRSQDLQIDGLNDRVSSLELTVNGRHDDAELPDFEGHEQRITSLENTDIAINGNLNNVYIRLSALEDLSGIGEGSAGGGIEAMAEDIAELKPVVQGHTSDITSINGQIEAIRDGMDAFNNADGELDLKITNEAGARAAADTVINSSLSNLSDRVDGHDSAISTLQGRVSTYDQQTFPALNGNISNLNLRVTAAEDTLEGLQDSIEPFIGREDTIANKMDSGYSEYPAPELIYTKVQAGDEYDDNALYVVKEPDSYSPLSSDLVSARPGDNYNSAIDYYVYDVGTDGYIPYTYVSQEAWQGDITTGTDIVYWPRETIDSVVTSGTAYDPDAVYFDSSTMQDYVYVDVATWEADVDSGRVMLEVYEPLYVKNNDIYETIPSSDNMLDPRVTYYRKDKPSYIKMKEGALMSKVNTADSYDSNKSYYYKNIFQGYDPADDTVGSSWASAVSSKKLYELVDFPGTYDMYKVSHNASDEVSRFVANKDSIFIIDSGFNNRVRIEVDGLIMEYEANRVLSLPVASSSVIIITTIPEKRGTGVRETITVKSTL